MLIFKKYLKTLPPYPARVQSAMGHTLGLHPLPPTIAFLTITCVAHRHKLDSFEVISQALRAPDTQIVMCEKCGEPGSEPLCKTCRLLGR